MVTEQTSSTTQLKFKKHFRSLCLGERQAARIGDLSRCRWFGRLELAFVGPFEHDLNNLLLQAGPLQHDGQRHSSPLGITHRALFPSNTDLRRFEEYSAVACALQESCDFLRWHLSQFIEADLERPFDRPFNLQPPRVGV